MTRLLTPEDDALATEYALSLLEGMERAAFEARLRVEPDLAEAVAARQVAFAELAADLEPVTPPAATKARVMARLFEAGAAERRRVWVPGWLAGALAASVVAAALLVVTAPQRFDPAFAAELAAADAPLRLVAEYDAGRGALRVSRLDGDAPEGRVLELWAIAGDAAPVSLGLLEGEATRLRVPGALGEGFAELTLAVSEEPPGGSPTGAPTGQVLAVAAVQPL